MFEREKLARPYAKALFEMAYEKKTYKQWSEILSVLSEISRHPQVASLVSNTTSKKETLIECYLAIAGPILNEEAKNLIRLLTKRKRLIVLPEIASLFEAFYNESENRVQVELMTAIPITSEQKQAFTKQLQEMFLKNVILNFRIDKSILGGFIARAGNKVFDNSLRGQLIQLKESMGK